MSHGPTDAASTGAHRRDARLLGVLASAASLAIAALVALALSKIAGRDVTAGVALLGSLLLARWCVAVGLDEWADTTSSRLREQWRRVLPAHLSFPRREGERARGDLALAIDRASLAPALDRLATSAVASLAGLVVVFWAAGWLPLVVTVALLVLSIPLYRRAGARAEVTTARFHERRALLEIRQLEVLQRAPELRALGAVDFGAQQVKAISDSEHELAMRAIRVALGSSLVTEFLGGVSVGLVAMIVGFALLDGRISLVRALVAVLVTSELFVQVRRYGVEFHRRDDARGARASLDVSVLGREHARGVMLVARALVTEARDQPVNIDVSPGDRVLVTGPSGAGKTTLLHTLIGWRSPRGGSVSLGDVTVGFVGVESALFSGTLRENLLLGAEGADEDVAACLRALGLDRERFDDLDARLLVDARGLSTGERVRLVLARALLSGAPLLMLDDIAGVLDADARDAVASVLGAASALTIIEASADTPILSSVTRRIEVSP